MPYPRCSRCGGLQVFESGKFCSSVDGLAMEDEVMDAMRCINCGCITDQLIERNRRMPVVVKRPDRLLRLV